MHWLEESAMKRLPVKKGAGKRKRMSDPKTTLDQKRIKTQKADKEGVRNTTDDILTNPNADNLSQEDLHEKLDD
jgi:hypothetical protein